MRLPLDRPRFLLASMAVVVLLVLASLAAMDGGIRRSVADLFGYGGPHTDHFSGGRDLFHTGVAISGTKQGERYSDFDARRDRVQSTSFSGFGCPDACDEHERGYRWAAGNEVKEPRHCRGETWEFLEGCAAYALDDR
jgi:hypothetical protein